MINNNCEHTSETQINSTAYLVLAIVSTLCCSVLLGIPAIIFASRISIAQQAGMIDEARDYAKKAKIFLIIGAVMGLTYYIIRFLLLYNNIC